MNINSAPDVNSESEIEGEYDSVVTECHKLGIWVMLDVVANHVACVGTNFTKITPFNKPEHYHPYCEIDFKKMWENRTMRENCRLFCLPDLDQKHPYVRSTLKQWIKDVVKEYGFDGLRIDTVAHVPVDFWKEYAEAAGVYQVGEVFNSDSAITAEYQGPLDAVLNYPLYDTVINVYAYKKSMYELRVRFADIHNHFTDVDALGTFIDNHDNQRFLYHANNLPLFKNALAFILFAEGIPIVYYGSEQAFKGGDDPYNRETLWTHMDPKSEMYRFLQRTIEVRKRYRVWNDKHVERFVMENVYIFSRGLVLICTTNTDQAVSIVVAYHNYPENTKLCNIYDSRDCVIAQKNSIPIKLAGLPKIYVPN